MPRDAGRWDSAGPVGGASGDWASIKHPTLKGDQAGDPKRPIPRAAELDSRLRWFLGLARTAMDRRNSSNSFALQRKSLGWVGMRGSM